jgi:hypothetical protein
MKTCVAAWLCCLLVGVFASATEAANRGLQTPDSRLKTPDSGLKAPDSRLKTLDSGLKTPDSGLKTPDSGFKTSELYAVVNSESAVLYGGMTASAPAIQKVAKGDVVRVDLEFTGETGHWFKVSTDGATAGSGYIKAEDLNVPTAPDTIAWEYKPPPDLSPEGAAAGDQAKAGKRILLPVTRAEIEKDVRGFFATRFGHGAPISADGQTSLHSRMGFDHSNAVDVAVSPDSLEGLALMSHLRAMSIPFIAFRRAVPGSATGAHIHVGIPSPRYRRLR